MTEELNMEELGFSELPKGVAERIGKVLSERRELEERHTIVAKRIMKNSKELSEKLLDATWKTLPTPPEDADEDLRKEFIGNQAAYIHAVASMFLARCVMATYELMGRAPLEKLDGLVDSALDALLAESFNEGFKGKRLEVPDELKLNLRVPLEDSIGGTL